MPIIHEPTCTVYPAWCIARHSPTELHAVHESVAQAIPGRDGRELRILLHAVDDAAPVLRVDALFEAQVPLPLHVLDVDIDDAVVLAVTTRVLAEVSRVTVLS